MPSSFAWSQLAPCSGTHRRRVVSPSPWSPCTTSPSPYVHEYVGHSRLVMALGRCITVKKRGELALLLWSTVTVVATGSNTPCRGACSPMRT
jgi:hypothetical protein